MRKSRLPSDVYGHVMHRAALRVCRMAGYDKPHIATIRRARALLDEGMSLQAAAEALSIVAVEAEG